MSAIVASHMFVSDVFIGIWHCLSLARIDKTFPAQSRSVECMRISVHRHYTATSTIMRCTATVLIRQMYGDTPLRIQNSPATCIRPNDGTASLAAQWTRFQACHMCRTRLRHSGYRLVKRYTWHPISLHDIRYRRMGTKEAPTVSINSNSFTSLCLSTAMRDRDTRGNSQTRH